MLDKRIALVSFVLLFIILFILCVSQVTRLTTIKQKPVEFTDTIQSFVINLDKNSDRLQSFMKFYSDSDIKSIKLERFNAVNGKQIDISLFVTPIAYTQIINAETSGYRMRHYELTRGAVGCFLSHTSLFNKLLKDESKAIYLIFEDDAKVPPVVLDKIKLYLQHAPKDWDILLFGVLRKVVTARNSLYDKIRVWWGLYGYVINKTGAQKIMNYLNENPKIDKQIDSLLSLMVIEKKLNVYSTHEQIIYHNIENTPTDIQLPVKVANNIDPFKYEDINL